MCNASLLLRCRSTILKKGAEVFCDRHNPHSSPCDVPTQLVFLDFIGYVSHAKAAADALIVTNSTAVAIYDVFQIDSNRSNVMKFKKCIRITYNTA